MLSLRGLSRKPSGKTTIVVAHRLSTIRNAHVIAVIDDGKVAELCPHDTVTNAHVRIPLASIEKLS